MARSTSAVVAAPLLLLSVLVSTAAAGRAVDDHGGGESKTLSWGWLPPKGVVQDACSKTQFPKICTDSLAAKPESKKATPRKLAELFVNIAAEKGAKMATFVHGKYNNNNDKGDALFVCYDSCSDDVEEAVAHLNGLIREPTDAKFLELKSWLSSTLGGTSTCEESCKGAPKSSDKDAVVNFSLDFEKLQRITLDLITEASGSMSGGIALPPSEAGAPSYGASAPYGGSASAGGSDAGTGSGSGSGSGSSSEGPAASGPSADAPAYGGSAASGPAADAPAASGPSGASAPSSSKSADAPSSSKSADGPSSSKSADAPSSSKSGGAKSPSKSAGAPGPSSGGSSSASAPSTGDDDDNDSDDNAT